ncbi:MAG: glycerol-3-phosphate dehydrogenase C-terminal domain-containing protein [Microthrixaceae bacterium]
MAADTIDAVIDSVHSEDVGFAGWGRSRTARLPLLGTTGHDTVLEARKAFPEVPVHVAEHLARRYGGEARALMAMIQGEPSLAQDLVSGLGYVEAEVVFAARYEMANTVGDVLSRRTRARIYGRDDSLDAAQRTAELMAAELGWDAEQVASEVEQYRAEILEERGCGAARDPPPGGGRDGSVTGMTSKSGIGGVDPGPGEPTPPIPIRSSGDGVRTRTGAPRTEVPDAVIERLRATGATLVTDDGVLAEVGRDWWPLAMTWATEGIVPATAAVVVSPDEAAQVAEILAVCNEHRIPVTASAGRSGVLGGSVPLFGGVQLDLCALSGIVGVDDTSLLVDVAAGTFGDRFEQELRDASRTHLWTLAPVDDAVHRGGWLACAAPVSSRRDTARSRTWSSASTWRLPTAAASPPAALPVRRADPT